MVFIYFVKEKTRNNVKVVQKKQVYSYNYNVIQGKNMLECQLA